MCEIRELTAQNKKDAEFVIRARFPNSALKVLEKVMANPLKDEHKGFGDILYDEERPVAFRAALRRVLYIGNRRVLARVRGLTCRLVDSPKDSIARLVEWQKSKSRGCLLAISNTQCKPTERRAVQNGAKLGPLTCKRFIWGAIRPFDCLLYFARRKILRMEPKINISFSTLSSNDFSMRVGNVRIRRFGLDEAYILDDLMNRYLKTNQGIVSSRSSDELKWIYGKAILEGNVIVLCAEDEKGPVGYLLLKSNTSCVRWLLGDMLVLSNNHEVMRSMMKAARAYLKKYTPAMMLESIGFSSSVDSLLREFMPHERKCDANFDSFNFFSCDDAERYNDLLLSDKSWFFGPYDGDMCLDD